MKGRLVFGIDFLVIASQYLANIRFKSESLAEKLRSLISNQLPFTALDSSRKSVVELYT
jgi:hypothetical protein